MTIHEILAGENVCSRLFAAFVEQYGPVRIVDKPAPIEWIHPRRYCLSCRRTVMYSKHKRYDTPEAALPTLAHELQHVYQYTQHPYTHSLGYALPQILAPLCLLGLVWPPLWVLMALVLPWPAYHRARIEAEAYAVSRHAYLSRKLLVRVDEYIAKIGSWVYWWAWPFKRSLRRWFTEFLVRPPAVAQLLWKVM